MNYYYILDNTFIKAFDNGAVASFTYSPGTSIELSFLNPYSMSPVDNPLSMVGVMHSRTAEQFAAALQIIGVVWNERDILPILPAELFRL